MYGLSPTAYRAEYPAAQAFIPVCIRLAYGRPQSSTFREDSGADGV
jgi:hypothetical protein